MNVADILNDLDPAAPGISEVRIWLDLPDGYLPLPLRDTDNALAEAEVVLRGLCPPEQLDLLHATLGTFSTLLDELGARNAVYCGLGWHQSPADGVVVSSSLVVSIQYTGGERNPRLVLGDQVAIAARDGEAGRADLVDLANGPALFTEAVRSLPRPALPGRQSPPAQPGDAEVYQLRAMVPSERGEWLVVLEFSTPRVEYGALYREMMVLLANSVSFTPPAGSEDGSALTQHIHGLLEGGTA
jgi:hypothetical protein